MLDLYFFKFVNTINTSIIEVQLNWFKNITIFAMGFMELKYGIEIYASLHVREFGGFLKQNIMNTGRFWIFEQMFSFER